MFFSVITKNLNWEILTKNFVAFLKDRIELRMKSFIIVGVHSQIQFLGREFTKTNILGRLPKGWGSWTVCRFKRRLSKKEE